MKILVNIEKDGVYLPMTKEQKAMFRLLRIANYTLQQKDQNIFTAQNFFSVTATIDTQLDEQSRLVAQVVTCPLTQ